MAIIGKRDSAWLLYFLISSLAVALLQAQSPATERDPSPDRQLLYLNRATARVDASQDEQGAADGAADTTQMWQDAEAALESGNLETAVQTVSAILHFDPIDTRASQLLRNHIWDPREIRSKPVRTSHRELKWKAGEYYLISTPHFVINTNGSEAEGRRLAELLEETYHIWSQVFVRHWTDVGTVRRAFAGRLLPSPSRSKHRIVFFSAHDQYVAYLKPWEPNIELSKGVYRADDRTAFFYAGTALEPYWRHELVHQLLAETGGARRSGNQAGQDAHAWLIEGIAIYFESLRRVADHFELGGFESPRLQFARYRLLQENFFVPGVELAALGREALKNDPRIRRIYTQAAGLTHFLMDGDGGQHRCELIELVRRLYHQPKAVRREELITTPSPRRIEEQYRAFLNVTDRHLPYLTAPSIKSLCLGQTDVTDAVADLLRQLDALEWLDLSYCNVSDQTVLAISTSAPLRQLSLQGTSIGDTSLEHISQFQSLEELDLSHTAVTDAGVRKLAGLTNLRTLWLRGTAVSEVAISELRDLLTLETLDFGDARMPEGAALRQQHAEPTDR